ncbi:MAG TPA: ATP-binding protein [Bacteroidota bacterium]|jgi:signal transduction histidine kinase|nr:ATP-binding protein [Bacteroidota bacterium]
MNFFLNNYDKNNVFKVLDSIKNFLNESESFSLSIITFKPGDILIQEDEENDSMYIIMEGIVELSKVYNYETVIKVDRLEPGDLVGLLTFWTGETAFTSAIAKTDVTAFKLTRQEFEKLSTSHPELNKLIQPLIINNLVERYRRVVDLNLKMTILRKELEKERNQLREAYLKLEQTSNRLIHQEKMATLGQLVAGVAHEINNPTSALIRSIEFIIDTIPSLFEENVKEAQVKIKLFKLGLENIFISSEELRSKMEELEKKYPNVNRSSLRLLAQMGDDGINLIEKLLKTPNEFNNIVELENLLHFYEIGISLKSVKISSERIEKIVKSLRSYSKQNHGDFELVDLRQGIEDTLLILGNKLKNFDFHINLREIPKVRCYSGEMNQVWTNIIINAIDAMGDKGILKIETGTDEKFVWVKISDSGPGIPEHLINEIFKPNFTTKTASGSFGLGLGLTISNEIVQKHGGRIEVENLKEGGACFTVYLPFGNN